MTVEKLIQLLQKWPKQYKVKDSHGRPITGVHLSHTSCEKNIEKRKGSVWIKFRKGMVKGRIELLN